MDKIHRIKVLCNSLVEINTRSRRLFYYVAHTTNYAMKTPISTMIRLYDSVGASPNIVSIFPTVKVGDFAELR